MTNIELNTARSRGSNLRSPVIVLALVAALFVATALPVLSISAAISPSSQTRAYGQTASWGAAWGSSGPYNVTWKYGDGATWVRNGTALTSQGFSRKFYPCPYTVAYTQTLDVKEVPTGATIRATARTTVTSVTPPCPNSI